jgi:hypothetical protein
MSLIDIKKMMAGNVSNTAITLKIGDQKMNNSDLIQIIADTLTYLTTDNEILVLKFRKLTETLEDLTDFRYQMETNPIETEIYAEATRLQNLIVRRQNGS